MVAHKFIRHDEEKGLIYNLVFSEVTFQIITLPAPILFDIHSGRYFFCPRTFMHTGRGHDPHLLSQSHHLIHIRSLFIMGATGAR